MQAALESLLQPDLPVRNSSELETFLQDHLKDFETFGDGDAAKIALVTTLFSVYESSRTTPRKRLVSQQFVPKIVAFPSFWGSVFSGITKSGDETSFALLRMVFEGLFSVLPSSSRLVVDFLKLLVANDLSPRCFALATLVAIQFINTDVDPDCYLFDAECLTQLNKIVPSTPAPVKLAFGLELYKLANQPIEPPLSAVGVASTEQLQLKAREILANALDSHALSELVNIITQLPQDIQFAHTIASVLQPLTQLTMMNQALANAIAVVLEPFPLVARAFWDENTLKSLELTRLKLPAALPTFISLARSHPDPMDLLDSLSSYMDFVDPKQLTENNVDESVLLADDTQIFPPRPTDNQGGVVLQKGTQGTVINTSAMGSLVMWNIEYNGWSLLGRVIENAVCQQVWDERAISTVFLINKTLKSLDQREQVENLVSMLSAALGQGDIIDVLQDQFEALLSYDFEHLSIVMLILQFFIELARVYPSRIFTWLRSSGLLERNGEVGYMSGIIGAVEVFKNDYSFTLRLFKLIQVLTPSYDRENKHHNFVMEKLLRHLVNVFESFTYWSYHDNSQREKLMASILNTLQSLSGHDILSVFLTENKPRLVHPFIAILENGSNELIHQTLSFAVNLVNMRSKQNKSYSLLERELYSHSPKLVSLYAENSDLKVIVAKVFESLVGAKGQEQPSLLAYLGTDNSKVLLTNLNKSIADDLHTDSVLIGVCRFFSAVTNSKQEGLSVLLMSGKDLRESADSDSLFDTLQDKIIKSHDYLSYEALAALLSAISAPSARQKAEYKQELIPVLVQFVKEGFETPFDDSVSSCYFIYSVAKALAVLSHAYFNKRDISALNKVLEDKDTFKAYLSKFFNIVGYRFQLHASIHSLIQKKNFPLARVHNPFGSESFPTYNEKFVYDIENDAIKEANLNLCFVHAQMMLVKAWSQLCTTLTISDAKLDTELASVEALVANTGNELLTPLFLDVIEQRISVCFFIQHSLSQKGTLKASSQVVAYALSLLGNNNIGMTVSAGNSAKPRVYKLLLRILGLQLELGKGTHDDLGEVLVTEVLKSIVIAQIPQVVSEAVQDPIGAAEDFKCLILLLRHSLEVLKPASDQQAALAVFMMDTNFSSSIAKLYSGKLENEAQHPVIAQLALTYVLEWLQAKDMSWYFLTNGIFQTLLDVPMSEFIQKGDITPFDTPYVHHIWTTLLKIFLILHDQLGERANITIQLFVGRFRNQMRTCFKQWVSASGRISSDLVEETLLTIIMLKSVRKRKDTVFEGQDELLQAIEHLSSHQKYLATRLAPSDSDKELDVIINEMVELKAIIAM